MIIGVNGFRRGNLAGPNPAPSPASPLDDNALVWDEEHPPAQNYELLGKFLAKAGDLFRHPAYGGGLLQVLPGGKHRIITRGAELAPTVVDSVPVRVMKGGKIIGRKIGIPDLNIMLCSETFLRCFKPVDQITGTPLYRPNFTPTEPGYNDGGNGYRIYYTGPKPQVLDSLETIEKFLGVMDFETVADRANAVAAALTVVLRNHFPGGKPIILATATKSHAGKDTTIAFASGVSPLVSISYQSTNWALQREFIGALKTVPDAAVVVVENARLDRRDRFIASAFLERTATDPEPFLFSTGTGAAVRIRNDIVLAISTNFGTVSEDILNRSLPIHLHPTGDVADRKSPIGNPRYEFLPANKELIAAEIRGMIQRWTAAGKPLDKKVQHPFSLWAQTIGGILKVNGFSDFLANYGVRKTADDPLRRGLGLIGSHRPDEWLRPAEWAGLVAELGLTKAVIPEADRENDESRQRGVGIVLTAHIGETFAVETNSHTLTLRLEKHRSRGDDGQPHWRYRFAEIRKEELPDDGLPAPPVAGPATKFQANMSNLSEVSPDSIRKTVRS